MSGVPTKRPRGRPPKDAKRYDSDDDSSEDRALVDFHVPQKALQIPKPDFKGNKHMFFQTTQVNHMSVLFKCLRKLLTSAEVVFFAEGWRIVATNSSKTALICLRVTEHTLDEGIYECGATYGISVNIDEISHRIGICRKADVMTWSLQGDPQDDPPDVLNMMFSQDGTLADMALQLRVPDTLAASMPDIEYNSKWDLPAEKFKDRIHALKGDTLIETITFKQYGGKRFTLSAESQYGPINFHFFSDGVAVKYFERDEKTGTLVPALTVAGDDPTLTAEEEAAVVKYSFPINEMMSFTAITKACKWVRLSMPETRMVDGFDKPKPLKLSYSIAALGEISFYLAPKIDFDD